MKTCILLTDFSKKKNLKYQISCCSGKVMGNTYCEWPLRNYTTIPIITSQVPRLEGNDSLHKNHSLSSENDSLHVKGWVLQTQDDSFKHRMIPSKILIPCRWGKLPSSNREWFPPCHRMIPSNTGWFPPWSRNDSFKHCMGPATSRVATNVRKSPRHPGNVTVVIRTQPLHCQGMVPWRWKHGYPKTKFAPNWCSSSR